MAISTNKNILITPGLGGVTSYAVSQIDFKWTETGVGTFIFARNPADLRASIYNWYNDTEPVLLFGGMGTLSGTQYNVSPYKDYSGSFPGSTLFPAIRIFPISGQIWASTLRLAGPIYDNSNSTGFYGQVLMSTSVGIAWTYTSGGGGGGGSINGSISSSQVAYGSPAPNNIQGSNNLWFDGTNLGIGNSSPGQTLTVQGNSYVSGFSTASGFFGAGTYLTNLNASNLTTGIVSSSVISGSYPGITNFVPYVGASQSVNLIPYSLTASTIGIDTNFPFTAPIKGQFAYDPFQKEIALGLGVSGEVVHVGFDLMQKVINTSGSIIGVGSIVYVPNHFTSTKEANSQYIPSIGLAIASDYDKSSVLGIVEQSIGIGSTGYVHVAGQVSIDTTSFTDADKLYLSATVAGMLTNIAPVAPNYTVLLGIALTSNTQGSIEFLPSAPQRITPKGQILFGGFDNLNNSGSYPTGISTFVYYQGNVGIGTVTPNSMLTVQGNVNISGLTTSAFFFGDGGALGNLNATNLLQGTVPSARVVGSYSGITSVGNLTQLNVIGLTTISQLRIINQLFDSSAFGGVSGQYLTSTGSGIGWATASAVSGVTGSGNTNSLAKFNNPSSITNSNISDTGTLVTISSPTNITGITTSIGWFGPGTYLTNLNATNLFSGTVPSARITGSYSGITSVGNLTQLSVNGIASALTFVGDGANITNLNATNLLQGTVPSARIVGSYSGITSVGNLTQLNVIGLTTVSQLRIINQLFDSSAFGGVSGQYLTSTGSGIGWATASAVSGVTGSGNTNSLAKFNNPSSITNSNISDTGTLVTISSPTNITGITTSIGWFGPGTYLTNLNASALVTGTVPSSVVTGSYSGITSVGTLGNLNVTGIVTAGTFVGDGANITDINATNLLQGTVPSARIVGSYSGITSVGNLTQLSVNGIASALTFVGDGANITNLNATNLLQGTVPSARIVGSYSGITSVGNLTSLSVNGIATINTQYHTSLSVSGITTLAQLRIVNQLYDSAYNAGTSGQTLVSLGTSVTWVTPTASVITGSGTINTVPKFTAGTVLGNSNIVDIGIAITMTGGVTITGLTTSLGWFGPGTYISNITATNVITGTLPSSVVTGSYSGITSVGTLGNLNVTGIATAGTFVGDGANITDLNATNLLQGTVPSARIVGSYSGITSVGNLTQLSVNGIATINTAYHTSLSVSGITTLAQLRIANQLYDSAYNTGTSGQTLVSLGTSVTWVTPISVAAGGGITGTIAVNQIAYGLSPNAIQGSNNLFYNGTYMGVNTNGTTSTFGPETLIVQQASGIQTSDLILGIGSVNSFLEINIINRSVGNNASADIVATINDGNLNAGYIDIGINNTAYAQGGNFGNSRDTYLLSNSTNMFIANATLGSSMHFITGTTYFYLQPVMTLTSGPGPTGLGGSVGIGTTQPTSKLHVVGDVRIAGIITAVTFVGDGANITNLNATNLLQGTVPSARITGSYSGITSVGNLTQLSVNGIASALTFVGDGANITDLNATNLLQGTVPSARIVGSYSGITSVGNLTQLSVNGIASALTFVGDGANITNLNATNLLQGTVPSARIAGSYSGITSVGNLTQLNVIGLTTVSQLRIVNQLYDSAYNAGVSGQTLVSLGTSVTWTTPSASGVTGSGTINVVPKFTAGTVLGNSNISDIGVGITMTGAVVITGFATALGWFGPGTYISNITATNVITGTLPSSVVTGSYSGITSVGNLTQLSVNGVATLGALSVIGLATITQLRIINQLFDSLANAGTNGQYLSSTGTGIGWVTASGVSGITGTGTTNTLSKFNNPSSITDSNITDTGTLVTISSPTNITGITTSIGWFGPGTYLTNLNASALVTGTVPSSVVTGSYSGITSVGTLSSLNVNGISTLTQLILVNQLYDSAYNAGVSGQTLVSLGTSVTWANASGGLTGAGIANQVALWSSSSNLIGLSTFTISNGYVAIGTSIATAQLHVVNPVGNVGVNSYAILKVDNQGVGFTQSLFTTIQNGAIFVDNRSGYALNVNSTPPMAVFLTSALSSAGGDSGGYTDLTAAFNTGVTTIIGLGTVNNRVYIGYQGGTPYQMSVYIDSLFCRAGIGGTVQWQIYTTNWTNANSGNNFTASGNVVTSTTGASRTTVNGAVGFWIRATVISPYTTYPIANLRTWAFASRAHPSVGAGIFIGRQNTPRDILATIISTQNNDSAMIVGISGGNGEQPIMQVYTENFGGLLFSIDGGGSIVAANAENTYRSLVLGGGTGNRPSILNLSANTRNRNTAFAADGQTIQVGYTTVTDAASAANTVFGNVYGANIDGITLAASNTGIIITNAATLRVSRQVIAGTNVNIQNSFAILVDSGTSRFGGNIIGLGSVGIGTTGPLVHLDVRGNASIVGMATALGWFGPGTYLTNLNATNVITGTLPSLVVTGSYSGITSVGTLSNLNVNGITTLTQLRIANQLYDSAYNAGTSGQTLVSLGTSVTWTTPSAVAPGAGITGTISATQIAYGASPNAIVGGSTLVYVNGNVGIGTTSPQNALHVFGTARVDGSIIINTNISDTNLQRVFLGASTGTVSTTFVGISTIAVPANYTLTLEGKISGWFATNFNESGKFMGVFFNAGVAVTQVGTTDIVSKYNGSSGNFDVQPQGTNVVIVVKSNNSANLWNWKTQFDYLLTSNT